MPIRKVVLRSGSLNYDTAAVSRETGVFTDLEKDPSRTIQSGKDEADINVIMQRFGVTGMVSSSIRVPTYGDYDTVSDFQTAMNVLRQAEESFLELPSNVRDRFGNSPQAFLEFASNPENIDVLRKWGLAKALPAVNIIPEDVPPEGDGDARGSGKRASKSAKASKESDGVAGSD